MVQNIVEVDDPRNVFQVFNPSIRPLSPEPILPHAFPKPILLIPRPGALSHPFVTPCFAQIEQIFEDECLCYRSIGSAGLADILRWAAVSNIRQLGDAQGLVHLDKYLFGLVFGPQFPLLPPSFLLLLLGALLTTLIRVSRQGCSEFSQPRFIIPPSFEVVQHIQVLGESVRGLFYRVNIRQDP